MVTLKLAETANGLAAGGPHDPRLMITGAAANGRVQVMRAMHDAIMVGVGTVLADDPLLTVRAPGLDERRPLRIVLDTELRLPLRSRLVATAAERRLLVIAAQDAPQAAQAALERAGVEVARVARDPQGSLDLGAALKLLGQRGITRVFSEGGPTVAGRLLALGLADEVMMFTAPKPFGGEGVQALGADARRILQASPAYRLIEEGFAGADRFRHFERIS